MAKVSQKNRRVVCDRIKLPIKTVIAAFEGLRAGISEPISRNPEPYPPYQIGTPEANEWIHCWRIGHYGCDRDDEEKNQQES